MSDAYLVYAGWGCFEVASGSVSDWFANLDEAKKRYAEIAKDFEQKAKSEADLIDSSPHYEWTSDEYFYAAIFSFPEVNLDNGEPDELSVARLKSRIEKGGYNAAGSVVEFTGGTWGEYGAGGYEESGILEQAIEEHAF